MIHKWADIKRRKTCPCCAHSMKAHKRLDGLSDTLDVDIWVCSDCRNEGRACTRRGTMATGGRRGNRETFSRKL